MHVIRPVVILGIELLGALSAQAGRTGGGSSSGGGALHQVSGGMATATSSSTPPSSSGSASTTNNGDYGWASYDPRRWCGYAEGRYDYVYRRQCLVVGVASASGAVIVAADDAREARRPPATFHFYVGAQKVHDSDGAFSLEASVRDSRFILVGTYTRFYESQQGEPLQLSMPTLAFGIPVVRDGGPTQVYFEGGVVLAKTKNDPVMDTSISGGLVGIRLETPLAHNIQLVGDAQAMVFESDIRAKAGRIGVRFHGAQLSMRVVDFSVGPALWGPELGFGF